MVISDGMLIALLRGRRAEDDSPLQAQRPGISIRGERDRRFLEPMQNGFFTAQTEHEGNAVLQRRQALLRERDMNSWHSDRSLEDSCDFLRRILDVSANALICTSASGKVMWGNRQAQEMLGSDSAGMDNQLLDYFIAPEDRMVYHRALDKLLKFGADSITAELKLLGEGEVPFAARVELGILTYEGSPVVVHTIYKWLEKIEAGVEASLESVSAGQNADREDRLLEKLQEHLPVAVGEIVALSYRALRNYETGDREGLASEQDLDRVVGELTRLLQELGLNDALVPGQARFSKQTVSLEFVVARVLEDFKDVFDAPQNRLVQGFLPTVEGDPEQLYLLFKHLIANAVTFRNENTPLSLTLDSFQGGSGVWHVLIKDNGIGFDNTDSERIFRPFVQLGPKGKSLGSGLGLTICQRIVKGFGGKMSALSEKGEGTTLIVTFPGGRG
ncbi:ATP-binding protein [Nitrospina watsonii]|nr:ATP-binding protein [Nitrospina watsonii]